ncbi:SNF2 family DNA-dependent chromodomain-containing ATPase, partial [Aureobasidium melanogenum]
MSDSEDELNVDLSRWKPRTANTAPQPSALAPPPRTFASINTPATATDAANHFEDDDFDIDAIVEGIADDEEDALQPRAFTPQPIISTKPRHTVQVVITQDPTFNRDDYTDCTYGANIVRRVLKEIAKNEDVYYNVEFVDRHTEQVSFNDLLQYENGQEALQEHTENVQDADDYAEEESEVEQVERPKPSKSGYVDTVEALEYLDQEDYPSRSRKSRKARKYDSDSEDDGSAPRHSRRVVPPNIDSRRSSRRLKSISQADSEDDDDDGFILQSDVLPSRKRKRSLRSQSNPINYADGDEDELQYHNSRFRTSRPSGQGVRQSGRSTRHQGDMQDPGVNDIYRSESEPRPVAPPKPVGARESFKDLPRSDPFRARHIQHCDSCQNGTNFAPLIYCQGCVYAYHKSCIGHRGSREHLVTKVGKNDFVLQCRRCIAVPMKKDPTAPDHGRCSDCKQQGASCVPFRERKTPQQEQKDREENNGEDPIYPVPQKLINNPDNVMFRCTACSRGFHFEHLPPKSDSLMDLDSDDVATQRLQDYSQDWRCKECLDCPGKVGSLVAWKPIDEDNYDPSYGYERVPEDEKAYLVRWDGKSYFQAAWMPGPWVWGTTAGVMRKAFAKRDEARQPKMRTEDAIPEDYLRIDIVLDVKYTSIVNISTEEIDKARIREVDTALVKYKGLGYEDVVWEKPPTPDDADRWTDFVVAYNDWVLGRFVKQPKPQQLKTRLEKARSLDFASKLEKKKQPSNITGGELMKYQMEGLNWLYYKWYTHKNAILADEMGLGKTIQIISFLATLVQDWNCFPFLVVVPNSTCANWRREVKQWAPSLRVVAYFGSKEARDLTYRYELFARDSKELRCHIVVTSYDCAADDSARKFFKSIPWQALIVDEGQRLKSDKSQLYSALASLRAPFKVLLTGTPLQNNARELFNLLQFLDDTFDASQLEEKFQELDQAKIQELHGIIRPFFLRRTKAQVLTFLPPMAQVIVAVSMSTVQKKLYKTILAKNPDLMRAIFQGAKELRPTERASLNNILMQLRKCLCHPFVYSTEIEERNVSQAVSHRNLVDASGKLQLLEMLLPKLKERGHRVLIFSQFLDMLTMVEDFLDGMQMRCQRLDGTISSLEKQKRIDEFNAPDSPLFAFLLSTRAGGVGINLATADTVIILDPDFNPHQDIQALSRAHRIGQKKKVLCFQIVTRASAEEKIMSYGRRKMALDHVLIEQMDAEDATDRDLEGILRHGTKELFDDDGDKDIKYDSASIDRLLEVSHIEHTKAGEDESAESTFSFARVWANNELEETTIEGPEAAEVAPDRDVWDKILRERERIAAVEAAAAEQAFGRGRRAKATIDYGDGTNQDGPDNIEGPKGADEGSPVRVSKRAQLSEDYDTDFQADSDEESIAAEEIEDVVDPGELQIPDQPKTASKLIRPPAPPTFRRVDVPTYRNYDPEFTIPASNGNPPRKPQMASCVACQHLHPLGSCPLKRAGVEYCGLCGLAHYGFSRICPHINSETQVREMIRAVKLSSEPGHLKSETLKYLTGLKGTLVQKKKKEAEKKAAAANGSANPSAGPSAVPGQQPFHMM